MHRLIALLVCMAFLVATTSSAPAQVGAQEAFDQAMAAYNDGDFQQARDLAETASQTDPDNPEVALLLGKAHYQLGELDEAIAAWQKTLELAPDEPYAKRMLAALQADKLDVDGRIEVVEMLIRDKLVAPALRECSNLLRQKAVTDAQRAKLMTLQVRIWVHSENQDDALGTLRRLLVLYPEQIDPAETTLLLGQAKLRVGGESLAEGLALLNEVVAEHADTPAAIEARYELIRFELEQDRTPQRAEALAQWLADHPDHPEAADARVYLVGVYYGLSLQEATPTADSPLGAHDRSAITLVADLVRQRPEAKEVVGLATGVVSYLKSRYAERGAHAAAAEGVEVLLAAPLPRPTRLTALRALAEHKSAIAMEGLNELARRGELPLSAPEGDLPESLAEVLSLYETINEEYPAKSAWAEQAAVAAQVHGMASKVLVPGVAEELKGPDVWAVSIALPVVRADADAAAVAEAAATLQKIAESYAQLDSAAARQKAAELSGSLVKALSPENPRWPTFMTAHASLLDSWARLVFAENVRDGKSQENATVSEPQRRLLAALEALVAHDVAQVEAAQIRLANHLQPWLDARRWEVAEELYTALAEALPQSERWRVELAVVEVWFAQVTREHQRLTSVGLSVPRELDPTLEKALLRCYDLQAGAAEDSPRLARVRSAWDRIVAHYKQQEYFDVAEAAIQLKGEQPVETADEHAAFQLAQLADEQARRTLARSIRQFDAADDLELTPEFAEVIDGWKQFVVDRPTSRLVPRASAAILDVGRLFEQHEAFEVAADVYRDLADFAEGIEMLSQPAPGTTSVAQRAAFAVLTATDARARKALTEQTAERKADDPPPQQISEEYAAAVAAYVEFIEAHEDCPLVGDALKKIMDVAGEYAEIDAWAVADGVYEGLLACELPIRQPERLKFARGLCQLGPAMPDHARGALSTVTAAGVSSEQQVEVVRLQHTSQGVMESRLAGLFGDYDQSDSPGGPTGRPGMTAGTPGEAPSVANLQTLGRSYATTRSSAGRGSSSQEAPSDAQRDAELLAAIRQAEAARAAQIAQIDAGNMPLFSLNQNGMVQPQQQMQQQAPIVSRPVLSEAELKRQQTAIDAAYETFEQVRTEHADTPTAEQCRGEILAMAQHWRELNQWDRSIALAERFLDDNPTDRQLPALRLEVARDRLAWASKRLDRKVSKQEMLAEVTGRFEAAREDLADIVAAFPKQRNTQQQAQWAIADSFLQQARVVDAFSPTLARGQYVRASKELRQIAAEYPDHPQIGNIPNMLWTISNELRGRGYDEEMIVVLHELTAYDPMHSLARQASRTVADTYRTQLKRPLLAAEAYQEVYYASGSTDRGLLDVIFQIGSELKNEKRYVEALLVLETFVDGAPKHPQAGQALTMIGQIHQTNEAWEDAITAYRRVVDQFADGQFVQEAKWSIAECTINLSRWDEATEAYRDYVEDYSGDGRVGEANRRIEVLKDLARYQGLVDEEGQRRATDAQYQIAAIVASELSNPVKSVIEYRKVVANWPESHWADDSLYAVGTTLLSLDEPEKGREALLELAEGYPTSPLADDAMYMVGKSYEDEATKVATMTRGETLERNIDEAQKRAYQTARSNVTSQLGGRGGRIAELKAEGRGKEAAEEEAALAGQYALFNPINVRSLSQQATLEVETLTATQLADRQDKTNAALRKAVEAYAAAAKLAGADKADEALLQMATIYDQRLKDAEAAMESWVEIVRQFSGTSVAEDASWRIAEYYQREGQYAKAIEAYQAFVRNYRRSPKAGQAQFAVAENYERLDQWVNAMDSYTNYINNFPQGPLVDKANEQIAWIKTYRL